MRGISSVCFLPVSLLVLVTCIICVTPVINKIIGDYRIEQDYLRENFFDVTNEFIKQQGYWNYYQSYLASNFSSLYKAVSPEFNDILKNVRKIRLELRRMNPEIERILWKYGDISKPEHPQVLQQIDYEAAREEIGEALQTIGTGQ